jgi:hypothetical protein
MNIWQHAQWMWDMNKSVPDDRLWFEKSFEVKRVPKAFTAHLACDSKYWLWLNGKQVALDGGLRRGPTPQGTYFDTLDLAPFLRKGKNTLEILVWYWGRTGFSHNDSGMAGLIFSAYDRLEKPGLSIVTDMSWRWLRDVRYAKHTPMPPDPTGEPENYRLSERSSVFDARLDRREIPDWHMSHLGPAGIFPWGTLVPRPMPMMKDFGLSAFKNPAEVPATVPAGRTVRWIAQLHANVHYHPSFRVEAAAGARLEFKPVHLSYMKDTFPPDVYICRDGKQQFEFLHWMNAQQVEVTIRNPTRRPLKIGRMGYRMTGYPADHVARFRTGDAALDDLCVRAMNTLRVCARDSWMDCPDRERAMWGDLVAEMAAGAYVDSAYNPLGRKCYEVWMDWQWDNGVLCAPVPGSFRTELPCQQLYLFAGLAQYRELTGDVELLRRAYPHWVRYYAHLERCMDPDGLLNIGRWEPGIRTWLWLDGGAKEARGRNALLNAIFALALRTMMEAARLAGCTGDLPRWRAQYERLRRAFETVYWDPARQVYRATDVPGEKVTTEDERVYIMGYLAGLIPRERHGLVERIIADPARWEAGTFVEFYACLALGMLGRQDAMLQRLRTRFAAMLATPSTTLWEHYPVEGTANHAWCAGFLHPFTQYVAGIRPLEDGFGKILVAPRLGGLKKLDVTVDTLRGPVALRYDASGLWLRAPEECEVVVDLECDGLAARLPKGMQVRKRTRSRLVAVCCGGEYKIMCGILL